jgi:phosphogluconate dehydratase
MMNKTVLEVTERIRRRSQSSRSAYLARVREMLKSPDFRDSMGCANIAHAWAALPKNEKLKLVQERAPHLAIVTAYNDMLSAHKPYERFPNLIRDQAQRLSITCQVAGGVPAMCDGITQGTQGMELSLFSRDVIAMATAVALSHNVFDAALYLGVCDKIVPGLLIGALSYGHIPGIFVPAGPMSSGISNKDKAKTRELYAQGLVGRDELLKSEMQAYHDVGTCTFYGTANSNQMLLEAMGLHVPGAAFVSPLEERREGLTRQAVDLAKNMALDVKNNPSSQMPIGILVDERTIVNAMVALMATGGSTNHLIHWVAVAKAAGIQINWDDFSSLSAVVPLIARVYPNGAADVNAFEAAGGPKFVMSQLIAAGLMHPDAMTVSGCSLLESLGSVSTQSGDEDVLRSYSNPFKEEGGLKLLKGNLGRAVIKVSSCPADRLVIEAPARVFDSQQEMLKAFELGELERDVVVVVRYQGPRANGMPELHKLTPSLTVLQNKGFRVALVTDGRMSGASGSVPAAIHVSPEATQGGLLSRVRDGDVICLDALTGSLELKVDQKELEMRHDPQPSVAEESTQTYGRNLFAGLRKNASSAEDGACTWL